MRQRGIVLVVLLLQLLTSCGLIKYVKLSGKEEREYYEQCQDFILVNNQMHLPVMINGIADTIFYDTGWSTKYQQVFLSKHPLSDGTYIHFGKTPQGSQLLSIDYSTCDLNNNLVNIRSAIQEILYLPQSAYPCDTTFLIPKVLGCNFLPGKSKKTMILDFEHRQICLADTVEVDTNDYMPVKSEIKLDSRLYIYLRINGMDMRFFFDSGCQGSLIINSKQRGLLFRADDLLIEGTVARTVSGAVGKNISVYRKEHVFLHPGDSVGIRDILYTEDVRHHLAGIQFISQFNWIIDYKNNRVYAKKIQHDCDTAYVESEKSMYKVDIWKKKLRIVTRNLSRNPAHPLGAIIKSVNGVLVKEDNICEYRKLLNKHKTWDELNVEIEK